VKNKPAISLVVSLDKAINGIASNLCVVRQERTGFNMTRRPKTCICSFIWQGTGTSTRRQQSDIFGLRVKLPLVTTCL